MFMQWFWLPSKQNIHLLHGRDGDTETSCPIDKLVAFGPNLVTWPDTSCHNNIGSFSLMWPNPPCL